MLKGKKLFFLLALIGIVGTTVASTVSNVKVVSNATTSWDDCAKNQHCTTKPRCGRYIDSNKDGACDHGQVKPSTANLSPTAKNTSSSNGCNGNCAACGACA